jgi:hypothetical protein
MRKLRASARNVEAEARCRPKYRRTDPTFADV